MNLLQEAYFCFEEQVSLGYFPPSELCYALIQKLDQSNLIELSNKVSHYLWLSSYQSDENINGMNSIKTNITKSDK